MKILVLGYGNTGSVIARDLASNSEAKIVVADKRALKTK